MSTMLDKYFFVCLVFPLVDNAACPDPVQGKVGDISLDYYFGLDDTLRSARFMENCNPRGVHDSCQKRCGPNHACLLGKCFCVDMKPQIKEEESFRSALDNSAITTTTEKGCSNLFARLRVLEELLRRTSKTAKGSQRITSMEDSSVESESEENNPKYIQLHELGMRPTLRHHIAHFCPNLDIARSCIHRCLKIGKPAFCGKDHVCYCGHKYGSPKDDDVASEEYYTQFQDLYERYFGPKYGHKGPTTTLPTRTLQATYLRDDGNKNKDYDNGNENGNVHYKNADTGNENEDDEYRNENGDVRSINEDPGNENEDDDNGNESRDVYNKNVDTRNENEDDDNGNENGDGHSKITNTGNENEGNGSGNENGDDNNTNEDPENENEYVENGDVHNKNADPGNENEDDGSGNEDPGNENEDDDHGNDNKDVQNKINISITS